MVEQLISAHRLNLKRTFALSSREKPPDMLLSRTKYALEYLLRCVVLIAFIRQAYVVIHIASVARSRSPVE